MFALDPDSSYGVSPPYVDAVWPLANVKRGNQIKYVLFPRSDVNKYAQLPYNYPASLFVEAEDIIRADITEDFDKDKRPTVYLSYFFDTNLRIINIKISDGFNMLRNRLIEKGALPAIDLKTYLSNLQSEITYWSDSGWVTEAELRAAEK